MNARKANRTGLAKALRWLGIAGGIALVSALGLSIYQQVALRRDQARYPAPGSLVTVNGHKMHLHCTGSGEPVVVIDAGNGCYSLDWSNIQRALEGEARVCTFDRPGYGWSSPAATSRQAANIVEELRALLTAAGVPGPYVLVGHSLGGLHVQLFAARYPQEVTGLVLIDTVASLDPADEMRPERLQQRQMQLGYYGFMRFLAGSGILRIAGPLMGQDSLPNTAEVLSSELRETYLSMLLNPAFFETASAELSSIPAGIEQLNQALGQAAAPYGDLPLIVLSAGKIDMPIGSDPAQTQRVDVAPEIIAQQAAMATRSRRGVHRLIEDSGHLIQIDRPDAVIQAVRDMLEECRSTGQ